MEENFTPQESLALIQSMISKAKTSIASDRFYFLLWGWFAFAAFLSEYLLKVVVHYQQHYIVWWLCIPVIVVSFIYGSRQSKKEKVQTYIGESMGNLWMGVGISFFV